MKRVFSSKLTGLLGAVVLATLLNAGVARAQTCAGNFTLTSETRWGMATLPPGHYTFELDSDDLIIVRSPGLKAAVMVMSETRDTGTHAMSSELVLVSRGRKDAVRELRLAAPGAVFTYAVPKANREQVAQAPLVAQLVPVAVNGK